MIRRQNPLQSIWPDDETFAQVKSGWPAGFIQGVLSRIWQGWDRVVAKHGNKLSNLAWRELEQKERSLAALHAYQILELQNTDDLFICSTEAHELETTSSPQAMPPSYDFAFGLRGGNRRILFPVEAKVVKEAANVSEMVKDLTEKYHSGKGCPLSAVAALVGYLLTGEEKDVFRSIENKTSLSLSSADGFSEHRHKKSISTRVPPNAHLEASLECHWMICKVKAPQS